MNEQITKREITNEKTIKAIFEVATNCRAINTNDINSMKNFCITVVEEKMSKFGQKQKVINSKKSKGRKEMLPEWFNENNNESQEIHKKANENPLANLSIDELMEKLNESKRKFEPSK
jgi:hypothetical protein